MENSRSFQNPNDIKIELLFPHTSLNQPLEIGNAVNKKNAEIRLFNSTNFEMRRHGAQ